ncbi:unnamed protein product [Allacma fusca]|uniref:EGF-like domain-containing protein n=1 Tax=Allacma fusca TaxID=39272 RepID=A0A8J2K427_9HEXA|nr:unnamed protein product [Allacma fusca]
MGQGKSKKSVVKAAVLLAIIFLLSTKFCWSETAEATLLTTQVWWVPLDAQGKYGDVCNETHTCDKLLHLACTNGLCMCLPNFYRNSNGQCLMQKKFDELCQSNFECFSDHGLVCWRGKCGCDPIHSVIQNGKCVGFPSGPCIEEDCDWNSQCMGKTCVCDPHYIFNDHDKRCKGRLGMRCTDATYCLDQFDCIDQRCTCRSNQVYDGSTGRCLSIVAESCYQDLDCVPNAECRSAGPHSDETLCQCKIGFVEHGPGFCRNGFGSSCLPLQIERTYLVEADSLLASKASDVHVSMESYYERPDNMVPISVVNHICDESRKLRCYSGKCGCNPESEIFDEKLGRCVGLAGTLCNSRDDSSESCVRNAKCAPFSILRMDGLGRCVCSSGYEIGPERRCIESNKVNTIDVKG